ncbi:hypothetical protein D3C86_1785610 [compost metagenome]
MHYDYTKQEAIVAYLDSENEAFEAFRLKIEEQISLLKERRNSLISNAVTGKVKI